MTRSRSEKRGGRARRALALALAAAVGFVACKRSEDPAAAPGSARGDAPGAAERGLVEEREDGRAEWIIRADGTLRVRVTSADGAALAPGAVTGSVVVGKQSMELRPDGDALAASLPRLEDSLTSVEYALVVKGARWTGTLDVPPGGTAELLAPPSLTVPEGVRGPNGGLVDVVGDQRVELVVDEDSGEVRVYFLDEKLEVVPVGDAEVTVGFAE